VLPTLLVLVIGYVHMVWAMDMMHVPCLQCMLRGACSHWGIGVKKKGLLWVGIGEVSLERADGSHGVDGFCRRFMYT
jgi:hypothetical protein